MKIKITSDSTCDLSPEFIKQHDISLVPLGVNMNGKAYVDLVDIFPEDIISNVDAGGELCTTTAVNMVEYHSIFEKLLEDYDAVVHINIGSGFSSCYQNACAAAQDFENVYVIDSENLSTGQGFIASEASLRSENCKTQEDVARMCDELRALTPRVETSFLLNRLDYMVKGGRCSSVVALGANLLNLKPCIEVVEGKMKVVKKYRGAFDKCLLSYVKDRLKERCSLINERMYITHTAMEQNTLNAVKDAVNHFGSFNLVEETVAGCTITCHCGPNCLGLVLLRSE